jgi:hypothetical protein
MTGRKVAVAQSVAATCFLVLAVMNFSDPDPEMGIFKLLFYPLRRRRFCLPCREVVEAERGGGLMSAFHPLGP